MSIHARAWYYNKPSYASTMVIDEARRIFYKECRWTCNARLARRSGTIFAGIRMMNRDTREQAGGKIDFDITTA